MKLGSVVLVSHLDIYVVFFGEVGVKLQSFLLCEDLLR